MSEVTVLFIAAGLVAGVAVLPPARRLHRLLGPRAFWLHVASAGLIAVDAVPPALVAGLWFAARADYVWAINGPFPFSHLGSGPFWLWAFVYSIVAVAGIWGAAAWLKVWAHSRDGGPHRETRTNRR